MPDNTIPPCVLTGEGDYCHTHDCGSFAPCNRNDCPHCLWVALPTRKEASTDA